jgi:hypothetical protein
MIENMGPVSKLLVYNELQRERVRNPFAMYEVPSDAGVGKSHQAERPGERST